MYQELKSYLFTCDKCKRTQIVWNVTTFSLPEGWDMRHSYKETYRETIADKSFTFCVSCLSEIDKPSRNEKRRQNEGKNESKIVRLSKMKLTKQGVRDLGYSKPVRRELPPVGFTCAHLRMRKGPPCRPDCHICRNLVCNDCGFEIDMSELHVNNW